MKNKTICVFLILLLAVFLPTVFVSAENTEKTENKSSVSTENTTVAGLQALIEQLQQQIKELQDQLAKLTTEVEEVKEELKLTKNLYRGLSDEEVKKLQQFLKQYSEIYPEGFITGYYGSLTEKAVKKFQEQHDIPATGLVGPLTREKIKELSSEEKIIICHYPPDKPGGSRHTIEIGESALVEHLAHGDNLGSCPELTPTPPVPTTKTTEIGSVAKIQAFNRQVCIITTNNSLFCWGQNSYSQLGDGTTINRNTPVQALDLAVLELDIDNHSCALKTDGSVVCWGLNLYGQLGNGTMTTTDKPIFPPTQVSGLGPGTAVDVVIGNVYGCALKTDGSVVCWGGGPVGDGTMEQRLTPVQVSGLGPGTTAAIFSDESGTCALKTDGSVVCWGRTHLTGYNAPLIPTKISSLTAGTIRSLALGWKNTCVLKTDGSVACRSTFTQVPGLTKGTTAAITIGHRYACALKTDGSVVCWGQNDNGQMGDGTRNTRDVPVQVSGLGPGTTIAISAGGSGDYTCALKTDGSVVCWGGGPLGQLDNNDPGIAPWISRTLTPIPVYGLNP